MTLLALVAIGAIGAAVSAWGLGRGGRPAEIGAAVGWVSLIVVLVVALAMEAPRVGATAPTGGVDAFNGHLIPNDYLRLVIGLWALDAVLFVAIGWLIGGLGGLRGLLPATLAAIVGGTVAFAATDLTLGSLAAGAVGLSALAVLLVGRDAIEAGAREVRVALAGTAVLVAVTAAAPAAATLVFDALGPIGEGGPSPSTAPTEAGAVIGLFAVAVALVVAVRLGSIPFHLRVPRLTDVAPPISLPLLLAWIPVPLGVAGIAIVDRQLAPLALPLEGEQALIVLLALVTLVGGALAAYISDDLRHATGYLVIADGGLVLLGLRGARPGGLGPDEGLAGRAGGLEDRGRGVVGGDGGPVPDAGDPGPARLAAPLADPGRRVDGRRRRDLRAARLGRVPGAGRPRRALRQRRRVADRARGARDAADVSAAAVPRHRPGDEPRPGRRARAGAGSRGARSRCRSRWRGSAAAAGTGTPDATADATPAVDGSPVDGSPVDGSPVDAATGRQRARRARAGVAWTRSEAGAIEASLARRAAAALRRDRTELLAAAVLALAVLAALTSWGALDIGGAASEAAPIVSGPSTD